MCLIGVEWHLLRKLESVCETALEKRAFKSMIYIVKESIYKNTSKAHCSCTVSRIKFQRVGILIYYLK